MNMEPYDVAAVDAACRVIAAELATLLAPDAGYISRRVAGAGIILSTALEFKLATLFGLNLAQTAVEEWSSDGVADRQHVGGRTGLN